jgi:type I restriction enzyme, S subunit
MNNWIVTPLEQLADISSGGTPSRAIDDFWGGDIPWATPSDITKCKTNYLYNTQDSITWKGLSSSSAKLLPAGTLLFTSRATIGEVRIATKQISTNQGFKNLIAKDCIDADFLFYQVINLKNEFVKYAAGSTFLEINRKDTGRILIPHPVDKNKQEKISHVLKTIDRTITHTEALIEKYQQIKAGLMHDLFTRGIGADGKLRPPRDQAPEMYRESSIGWIPQEWSLSDLSKVLAKIDSGWSPACPEVPPGIGEWGVLKVSAVTRGVYDCNESKTLPDNLKPIPSLEVRNGDVIMTRANGVAELVGKCVQVSNTQEKLMLSDKLLRLSPDSRIIVNDYLGLLMCSDTIKNQIDKSMNGSSGQRNISQADIRRFICPIPCKDEQESISYKLFQHQDLIQRERTFLEKLIQQKSGLMHDLLTGKVQVNNEEIT